MEQYDYSQSLEKLNSEYQEIVNSKEYSLGKSLLTLKKTIRHCDLKKVREILKVRKIDKQVQRENLVHKKDVWFNRGTTEYCECASVIYSCITGNYDIPQEPLFVGQNQETILYTDNPNICTSGWSIKQLPDSILRLDNTLINRYIKLHPFELFIDKEFSVYIDGNVQAVSDLRPLFSIARNCKTGIAMHLHPDRDCVYDEGRVCLLYNRGKPKGIASQLDQYKSQGFPPHFGLLEATVIVTDLKNKLACDIYNAWWKEFIQSTSYRDQLALPKVLWEMGLSISDIGILGSCIKMNPKFRMKHVRHNSN